MGCVVVHDEMDIKVGRDAFIDVFEKLKKFRMSMARQALLNDFSAQRVERGEKRGGSIANVVVRLSGWHARTKRKYRGGSIQRLHAAFFIDAQDDCIRRRIHVEPNHVAQLLCKVRVCAELEALNSMGLQIVGTQDVLYGRTANAVLVGQIARTPVSRILGRRVHGGFGDRGYRLWADQSGATGTRSIRKHTAETPLFKALPYLNDVLSSDTGTARNFGVRKPIGRCQDNSRSKNRALRSSRTSRALNQRKPHFRAHTEAISSMIRHDRMIAQNNGNCNAIKRSGH